MSTLHGGADALGVALYDFSTNSNACGPCPHSLRAVQACDPSHYPDPAYTELSQQLAQFHQVAADRILLAGSASEFIYRITAWVKRTKPRTEAETGTDAVSLPRHAYGDYAAAAKAWGLVLVQAPQVAALAWGCEPSSPLGQAQTEWSQDALVHPTAVRVLDCAYAPLRLSGGPSLLAPQQEQLWQLWTPNKALGLTGVRGAYAIAPVNAQAAAETLKQMCPSWPLGAHAVAMLQSWLQPATQAWLAQSRITLRHWKQRQLAQLESLGWTCLPSEANFFTAQPFAAADASPDASAQRVAAALTQLRQHGIKLRDASSFGLPGLVRLGVLAPAAQDALVRAWKLNKDNQ